MKRMAYGYRNSTSVWGARCRFGDPVQPGVGESGGHLPANQACVSMGLVSAGPLSVKSTKLLL